MSIVLFIEYFCTLRIQIWKRQNTNLFDNKELFSFQVLLILALLFVMGNDNDIKNVQVYEIDVTFVICKEYIPFVEDVSRLFTI